MRPVTTKAWPVAKKLRRLARPAHRCTAPGPASRHGVAPPGAQQSPAPPGRFRPHRCIAQRVSAPRLRLPRSSPIPAVAAMCRQRVPWRASVVIGSGTSPCHRRGAPCPASTTARVSPLQPALWFRRVQPDRGLGSEVQTIWHGAQLPRRPPPEHGLPRPRRSPFRNLRGKGVRCVVPRARWKVADLRSLSRLINILCSSEGGTPGRCRGGAKESPPSRS